MTVRLGQKESQLVQEDGTFGRNKCPEEVPVAEGQSSREPQLYPAAYLGEGSW